MFVCYLDESGVPENAGTHYFVLVGLAIEAHQWKTIEAEIRSRKATFGLKRDEIHTAWMARRFAEQERIPDFEKLSWPDRRKEVERLRTQHLIRLAASGTRKQLKSAKKNYRKTACYVHLTRDERLELIRQLADTMANWQDARLFAEAIDKRVVFAQPNLRQLPFEFAFTELIQRYEYFLKNRGNYLEQDLLGFIVQDNNQTVAKRLTNMMIRFHNEGTRWTNIDHIFETPLFVDSQLTPPWCKWLICVVTRFDDTSRMAKPTFSTESIRVLIGHHRASLGFDIIPKRDATAAFAQIVRKLRSNT